MSAIVEQALKDLFKSSGHFSICQFDRICKELNVIPPPGHHRKLNMMHCVDYKSMTRECRDEVATLVMETLNCPGFEFEVRVGALSNNKGPVLKLLRNPA